MNGVVVAELGAHFTPLTITLNTRHTLSIASETYPFPVRTRVLTREAVLSVRVMRG